ncbi:MAG: type II toxin-antitoxin system VapC family toxin [Deltaproteobacteria bacterium]|nr:type II toxin-antitoxin system VapC family toxin [Deltaproteobacteria bacterium]
MAEKIFVDTSGFFAFLNKADENHEKARKGLESARIVTSSYIFDELMTLLTARGQKDLSISFGEQLRADKMIDYHFVTSKEEEKAWNLYKKYRDHSLSFTDSTTLVLLKELRIGNLLSFDETLLRLF